MTIMCVPAQFELSRAESLRSWDRAGLALSSVFLFFYHWPLYDIRFNLAALYHRFILTLLYQTHWSPIRLILAAVLYHIARAHHRTLA
jgi:hypothetical protein